MDNLKQKVVKGTFWLLLERLCVQLLQFVVSMFLARLLSPSDYGTVALLSIFFAVTSVLVDGGFCDALIQKQDADDLDYNSVFYLNVGLSVIAYIALFISAPFIANFYETPVLVPIVRVASITIVFNAINAIQNAELTKKMLFDLGFRIALITCLASAVCGLVLAFAGYGVWALVWSMTISGAVGVVARWFIISWRPKLMFSFSRLRPLFSYGWKMSVSALLDQFFANLNGLLIGKFYTKADLAYVSRGDSLPKLAMSQIDGTLGRVSFPALVEMQNDRNRLRETMRRMMICSTFLIFPLMSGIAVCSKSLLVLLFGDQWAPAAPYMAIACFSYALWPFHTINLKGIQALGRSDIFLKLEIVKKVLKLAVIMCAFRHSLFVFILVSALALGPLGVLVNAWPNKRLLNYTVRMQMLDVFPTALICVCEIVVVYVVAWTFALTPFDYSVTHSAMSLIALLVLQFIFGASSYILLACCFRIKALREYARVAMPFLSARSPAIACFMKEHLL